MRRLLIVEVLDSRLPLAIDAQLVKDIDSTLDLSNEGPSQFVQVGNTLFFTASTNTTGVELWKTDGTAIGTVLVKDIWPGSNSSAPANLTNVNGTLYFSANHHRYGRELWKSDGTEIGTVMVKDVLAGSFGSDPVSLANINGTLFFQAKTSSFGQEIMKSDGTSAGTVMIKDIRQGPNSSVPSQFTNVNGTAFFIANDGTGAELWKSNGTSSGTVLVKDIRTGLDANTYLAYLTNVNGTLFFTANDGSTGRELWKSDGSTAGTQLVKDIAVGSASTYPVFFTNVNGVLFFVSRDSSGARLWKSDGSFSGTTLIKNFSTGVFAIGPLTNLNGTIYFYANDGINGQELWKSDGTVAGTELIKDLRPGVNGSFPTYITNVDGTLFFRARDDSNGFELWKSDGTSAGTMLIKDIRPGIQTSYLNNFTSFNGSVFFQANDGTHGKELWKSDGTIDGTLMLKDIHSSTGSSNPDGSVEVSGVVYFAAGNNGSQLWKTDGTAAGTLKVATNFSYPKHLTNVNGVLYFQGRDSNHGTELWRTDGTANGTMLVKDITSGIGSSNPVYMVNVNGTLYFSAANVLWKSDGTTEGTVAVKDSSNLAVFSPLGLTNVGNILYFVANTGEFGFEPWRSDGTASGTHMLKDIWPGVLSSSRLSFTFMNVNGTIYFKANDGSNGYELWKTSGTTESTTMVKNIRPFSSDSSPQLLTNVNGTLFFRANDGTNGTELWKSDGTSAGTIMVKDLKPGFSSSFPRELTNVNGTLFFRTTDQSSGYENWGGLELWKSNGTSTGTTLVKDFSLGKDGTGGNLSSFTNVNGTVYFRADDGFRGDELWSSDGSIQGTRSLANFVARQGVLEPQGLLLVGSTLFYSAPTDDHGVELWRLDENKHINISLTTNVIPENSGPNAIVGVLGTTDVNTGDNFSYTFVTGPGDFDNSAFSISGSTLIARNSLNFEEKAIFTIRIRSTDQQGLWIEKSFDISVTNVNESPSDIVLSPSSVPENAGANAVVGTLITIDPDFGSLFNYTFASGVGDADNAEFFIDGSVVRAKSNLLTATKSTYSVRIRSTDQGGLFTEKPFTITVYRNDPPIDLVLAPMTIPENAGVNAIVGALSTTDPNLDDSFTYSLVAGAGDTDNASFSVFGSILKAAANFDFETKSTYNIRLRTKDRGGLTFEKSLSVSVDNVNEVPIDLDVNPKAIPENLAANSVVGDLTTTDTDQGDTFSYTLVSGSGDFDNGFFNISGSRLRASNSFNFEDKSSYSIRLRSTDQGGLFFEKPFTITVNNVNEAPTSLALTPTTIAEGAGVNAAIGMLSAIDPDSASTFTFVLVAGTGDTGNAAFNIDGSTLRATTSLDFETQSSYSIRVRATDQGGLFIENTFTVTVTNINEAPTDIALNPSTIAENAGANATVGSLTTADPDSINTFTYSLVAGSGDSDNSAFNISGSTLRANNSFNFETKSNYSVRIRSTDQGGLFTEKTFTVAVTDANEVPFDIFLSSATIAENAGANATVGTLVTTDPDSSNTFTYSLVTGAGDADNTAFNISGSTLRASSSLNFETKSSYSVRIRSTDQGGLFTEKTFTVTVTDANETPVDVSLSPATIAENAGADATVGTLTTTDPDSNNTFTYALVAGSGDSDNTAFNISGSTLRATSSFNFETKSSYSVRIRSTDQGGLFTEKTFTVAVTNANETPVDISLSPATVAENAGDNATVGTLTTTDPDSNNTFTYSFVAGSGDTDNTAFNINGSTLRATDSLNFETKSSYSVRIRSTDQGGLFTEKAFTVTVADANETPIDISLSPATVVENAGADATVGTLTTTDPDSNNSFTYALVAGSGDADNTAFNISGSTLRATSNLNFETKSSYSVRIRSTDQGGLFTEKTFTVAVTNANETPVDISLSPATVAENAGDNATVGTLTTTDPDSNNTFTYSLVAGAGDADNAAFNLSGSTLRAANSFNFESKSSYSVRIRSTDQGGLFIEKEFTVTVTNVNETPFDINLSSSTIAENAGANFTIGSLTTTDPDSSNTFTYTLVAGAGDSDNGAFNINDSTLRASSSFNFEFRSNYSVRIRATDQDGLFTEKAFTIAVTNVNETPTDIALSQLLIAENADANTAVGTLSSSDPDSGSTFGYTLVSGLGDSDNAAFNINGASLRASSAFDFETRSSYSVRIRSTDQDGLFTEKTFLIQVSNVNELPVDIVLSQLLIAENAGVNATVGTFSTSDPDAASSFTYVLAPGVGDVDNSAFTVIGAALRASSSFDFETKSSYSVRIRSTDQGGLFTEKTFTISVTNINETPTDIALSQLLIAENSGENASLGTLTTSDPDSVDSFNYALVTGAGDTDNGAFNISGSILRASNSFDFENRSSYTIRVRSTDQGGLFTEKTFTIAVTNVNETPTDILLSTSLIAENTVVDSTLGNLGTTDPDIVSTFAYALVAGVGDADNAAFNIVGDALRVSSSFDFETKSSYTVRIRSTDQGGLFTERSLSINVTDLNETPVAIASSQLSLTENAGSNAQIGLLSTQDPDAGDAFNYSLVPGVGDVDNAMFNIDGSILRATSSLNFESRSSYAIRIRSTDRGGLFVERSLVVSVTNVNESPLDLNLSVSEVAENAGADAVIGSFSTIDPDTNDTFIYTLIPGLGDADNGDFVLVGATLRANANFDFESKPKHTVRVRSTDQGGLTTEKVFTVSVIDVNDAPQSIQLSKSSVDEGLPIGTEVGTLSTTDPDAVDAFVYSLVAGIGSDDNSRFVVSGDKLKSTEVFDFQSKSSYSVRIRSTDKGNLSTESTLRIDIRDTTKPRLVSVERSKAISNPTNGSELEFIVNFSEAVNSVTASSFVVSSTKTATINAVIQLTPSSYRVKVAGGDLDRFNGLVKIALSPNTSIKDLAGNSMQPATPAIDEAFLVDHAAPVATVNELITKLIRPTISGTVSDSSATISITIAGRSYAAVNDGNGNWTFNGSGLVDALQAGRVDVAVSAQDAAGNVGQDSTSQEILVILHAPTNLQFTAERVHDQMNSQTSDILFGQLSATDLDPVDQLSWRLTSGPGDQDNSSFFVSGTSVYLRRGQVLNYDAKSQYSVRVEASDLAGNITTVPVILKLQPLPIANDDRFALVQGKQMVIDVKANDMAPDNNLQQLTIRLVSQNSSSVGTVEVTSDNRILLTANNNAYGILDVYYRLSDPRGGESRDAKIQLGVSRSSKQNPWFQLDVNDNGLITPSDALLIINVLNDQSSVRLVPDGLPNPAYLDVNGDKRITPSDALVVINYLNSRTASEGEFDVDYSDLAEIDAKAKKTRARAN